jgi:hypothetical protein
VFLRFIRTLIKISSLFESFVKASIIFIFVSALEIIVNSTINLTTFNARFEKNKFNVFIRERKRRRNLECRIKTHDKERVFDDFFVDFFIIVSFFSCVFIDSISRFSSSSSFSEKTRLVSASQTSRISNRRRIRVLSKSKVEKSFNDIIIHEQRIN